MDERKDAKIKQHIEEDGKKEYPDTHLKKLVEAGNKRVADHRALLEAAPSTIESNQHKIMKTSL